jgi:hypothetical protein
MGRDSLILRTDGRWVAARERGAPLGRGGRAGAGGVRVCPLAQSMVGLLGLDDGSLVHLHR